MDESLAGKQEGIRAVLRELRSVVVAYSGGVDSALVADIAFEVLGRAAMVAFIADSDSLAAEELTAARGLAEARGFPLTVVATQEMQNPAYTRNDRLRCYHCKTELFERAGMHARAHGFAAVVDGFNRDDRLDYRPGKRAGDERGVRSPLAEAGLTKQEVRELARQRGLPVWDKPAAPCLSSRLPYGEPVTQQKLRSIALAEASLRELGFAVCRVRHHGEVASVEVPLPDLERLRDPALLAQATRRIQQVGYRRVHIDPEGFRSGKLNDPIRSQPA